jgi:predicted nucleotidyltransferase
VKEWCVGLQRGAMAIDYEAVNKIISQYVADVKAKMRIDKVYLYGSYARRDAQWDSDVDLCFFSKHFKNETILADLNTLWELKRPLEVAASAIFFEDTIFPMLSNKKRITRSRFSTS